MKQPETYYQAQKLLQTRPVPADLIAQLDALEKQTPEKARQEFGRFYEAAMQVMEGPPAA